MCRQTCIHTGGPDILCGYLPALLSVMGVVFDRVFGGVRVWFSGCMGARPFDCLTPDSAALRPLPCGHHLRLLAKWLAPFADLWGATPPPPNQWHRGAVPRPCGGDVWLEARDTIWQQTLRPTHWQIERRPTHQRHFSLNFGGHCDVHVFPCPCQCLCFMFIPCLINV